MAYELNFNTRSTDQGRDLDRIAQIIEQVTKRTAASSGELKILESVLRADAQAGRNLDQTLKDLARSTQTFGKETRNAISDVGKIQGELQRLGSLQARAEEENRRRTQRQLSDIQRLGRAQEAAIAEDLRRTNLQQSRFLRGASSLGSFAGVLPGGTGTAGAGVGNLLASGVSGGALAGTAAIAALAAITAGTIRAANSLAEYSREQRNIADRTGLSVTQTQLFTRSADLAGVKANSLTIAMRTLSQGLSENSEEGKKAKNALAELGISGVDALRPMGDLLPLIFEKMSKLEAGAERDRIAIELFGRSGLELIPLAEHFSQVSDAVRRSGVIISEDGIKKALEYQRQVRELGLEWDALVNKLKQTAVGTVNFAITGGTIFKALYGAFNPLNVAGNFFSDAAPIGAPQSPLPKPPDPQRLREEQRQQEINRINLSHETAQERLQSSVKDLRERRTQAENAFRGASFSDAPAKRQALVAIDQQLQSAEAQLKGLNKKDHGPDAFALFLLHFQDSDVTPERRISNTLQDDLRKGKESGLTQEQLSTLAGPKGAGGALQRALEKRQESESKREEEEALKLFSERQSIDESISRQGLQQIKKRPGDLQRVFGQSAALNPSGPSYSEQSRIAADAERHQERLVQLLTGPGGELAAVEKIFRLRADEAKLQLDLANQKAKEQRLNADEAKAIAENQAEYDRKLDDIRKDRQIRNLELVKQQEDRFAGTIQGGFRALVSGGGAGLGQFVKGQALGTAETVVGNAARLFYPQIQGKFQLPGVGTADNPSILGKLFGGTAFGAQAKTPEIVSRDKNTVAIDQLTAVLSGQPAGGSLPGVLSSSTVGGPLGILGRVIPGLSTFGSDVNGITGRGGLSGSGSSAPLSFFGGAGSGSASSGFGGLSGILGGVAHTGDLTGIFSGISNTKNGAETLSGSERLGAAVGTAAVLYGAERGIASGIRQGGAKGFSSAAASGLGAAAALDPEPISKAVLGIASLATGFVSALLPDPKEVRRKQIEKELATSVYQDPVAQRRTQDIYGHYTDYDKYGHLQTSDLSAIPQITEPYITRRNGVYYDVPGQTTSPFGGGGSQKPTVIVNAQFNSIDPKSGLEYFKNNPDLANGVVHIGLTAANGPAQQAVKDAALGFS